MEKCLLQLQGSAVFASLVLGLQAHITVHPVQKRYNKRYRHFNNDNGKMICDSMHAEIAALQSIPEQQLLSIKNWSKVSVYVCRIATGLKDRYGCAKPCEACMNCLIDYGITNIYFTDWGGYGYLKVET